MNWVPKKNKKTTFIYSFRLGKWRRRRRRQCFPLDKNAYAYHANGSCELNSMLKWAHEWIFYCFSVLLDFIFLSLILGERLAGSATNNNNNPHEINSSNTVAHPTTWKFTHEKSSAFYFSASKFFGLVVLVIVVIAFSIVFQMYVRTYICLDVRFRNKK